MEAALSEASAQRCSHKEGVDMRVPDQRALLRLAAFLRGEPSGVPAMALRANWRCAASCLSSACLVERLAACAARRSAELGRAAVGRRDTVTLLLDAIAPPWFRCSQDAGR